MRVLYLSYTGLLEPLGQSQVFAYLRKLSRDHNITLITFEKPADAANSAAMAAQRRICDGLGIRWIALTYHHRPRLLATAWDLLAFTWVALREARRQRIEIVHCRSYIPSFVGLIVKRLAGPPFIFDMRAFWPEEMVAAGRLKQGSAIYRALKFAERVCLKQAAAVVSLTHAAVDHMRSIYGPAIETVRFAVIPTCVDLDRFRPNPQPAEMRDRMVIGSIGSVLTGWFKFDWLMSFVSAAGAADPGVMFKIVTTEDAAAITAFAGEASAPLNRLEVFGAPSAEMPRIVPTLSAVAMFFTSGVAKLGSCPTRMGEVLACGIPVVVNAGVGDVEAIVRDYAVGVIADDASAASMRQAATALVELLSDSGLADRCRRAAEEVFSLDLGVERYDRIYRDCAL